jgi:hypothetical protein
MLLCQFVLSWMSRGTPFFRFFMPSLQGQPGRETQTNPLTWRTGASSVGPSCQRTPDQLKSLTVPIPRIFQYPPGGEKNPRWPPQWLLLPHNAQADPSIPHIYQGPRHHNTARAPQACASSTPVHGRL